MPKPDQNNQALQIVIKDEEFNGFQDPNSLNFMKKMLPDSPVFGPGEPKPSDVEQGAEGSCYFLAILRAMARKHPEILRNMVEDHGDTVTFHFYKVLPDKSKCPVDVTVDKSLPNVPDGKHSAPWVLLFEKAFITAVGATVDAGVKSSDLDLDMRYMYANGDSGETIETFFPQTMVKNDFEGEILRAKPESKTPKDRLLDYLKNLNAKIRSAWEAGDVIYVGTSSHVMSVAGYHEDKENPENSTIFVYDQKNPLKSYTYHIKDLIMSQKVHGSVNVLTTLDIIHPVEGKAPIVDNIRLNRKDGLAKRMMMAADDEPVGPDIFFEKVTDFLGMRMDMINHISEEQDRLTNIQLNKAKNALKRGAFRDAVKKLAKDPAFSNLKFDEMSDILNNSRADREKTSYLLGKICEIAKGLNISGGNEGNLILYNFFGQYERSRENIDKALKAETDRYILEKGTWSEADYLAGVKERSEDFRYLKEAPARNAELGRNIISHAHNYEEDRNIIPGELLVPPEDRLTDSEEKELTDKLDNLLVDAMRNREKRRDEGTYDGELDGQKPNLENYHSTYYVGRFRSLYQELLATKSSHSDDTPEFQSLERVMGQQIEALNRGDSPAEIGKALILCRRLSEKYQQSHLDAKLNDRRLRRLSIMAKISLCADQFDRDPLIPNTLVKRQQIGDEQVAVRVMNYIASKAIDKKSKSSAEYKNARALLLNQKARRDYISSMLGKETEQNKYFKRFLDEIHLDTGKINGMSDKALAEAYLKFEKNQKALEKKHPKKNLIVMN